MEGGIEAGKVQFDPIRLRLRELKPLEQILIRVDSQLYNNALCHAQPFGLACDAGQVGKAVYLFRELRYGKPIAKGAGSHANLFRYLRLGFALRKRQSGNIGFLSPSKRGSH